MATSIASSLLFSGSASGRAGIQGAGRNANVTTSLPSSSVRKGTSTSSISMPASSASGSDSVSRASTFTSPASSMYPIPNGTKASPVGPMYGGDGGGKY